MAEQQLELLDIIVLIAYFVIVIGFGLWSSLKNRGTSGGYFLAGRSMHFVLVGASLFASNIGSGHFVGLAGSGASTGIGVACFELNAIFVLLILGWVFVPVYIASGIFTMPEYMRVRFGGQRIRVYLAVLALLLSVFTKIAADLYAGAIFIQESLGWNLYLSITVLLAIAALFSICGGLTAVIWTDFIQTIIMLIGALYLMVVAFATVGVYSNVAYLFLRAAPSTTLYDPIYPDPQISNATCGIPPYNSMHLLRPADDPSYPWPGILIGATINSIWYWCTDQVIVQRTLSAKNLSHAKGGTILAGYLKFLPMWIIVIPGMISRVLYTDTIGCADPDICFDECGSRSGCTNLAYSTLVLELMPVGARGLMMAVMIASLMSSLTSVFNSSATIFVFDIWVLLRKKVSYIEEMIVARVFVLVMVGIGIAWIPIVQEFSELFTYIQSVTSFLAPPICACYLLAVLWERTTEFGAFWGLMLGLAVGLTRFIWESVYPKTICGVPNDNPPPDHISNIHYLHFGIILWGVTFIAIVILSLLSKPIDKKHLVRLTYWTRYSTEERVPIDESMRKEEDEKRATMQDDMDGKVNPGYEGSTLDISEEEEKTTKKTVMTWLRLIWDWTCGIEEQQAPVLTPEEKEALEMKQNSIHEDTFERKLCDFNAITLATLAFFVWGFFY